ncbi:MAG: bifunctional serine/threonine-protein kinase/formylglycine-generating enzyme family protein [Chlamydiota bacterium]
MDQSKILGDYNIIKQIGQGPLGSVYLAEHRFMKKHFALKVLPHELSSDRAFIQRFEDEVSKLSSLEHPNIVKVHNISYADGVYFLVTDCVVDERGETTNLAQYIISKREKLSESELYTLLEQVAGALDYAHDSGQGISHCGLKLNNILVSQKKSGVQLLLSDFGLTRIIGPGAVLNRTFKTVADALELGADISPPLGSSSLYPNPESPEEKLIPLQASFLQTFAFLAPEQKQINHPASKGVKVDVYAFGILAYYLSTGKFPEGFIDMPSKCLPDFRWNWDSLVKNCLQCDPEKRVELLLPTLRSVSETVSVPVSEVVELKQEAELVISKQQVMNSPPVVKATEPQQTAENFSVKVASPSPKPAMQPVPAASVSSETAKAQQTQNPERLRPVLHDAKLERPVTDPDPGAIFSIDSTVTHYVPEEKEVKDIQPILTEMVVIKGGAFSRGSSDGNRDEMPKHQVQVESFAIDVHAVSNEQFVRFLEVLGGEKDSFHHDVIRLKDSRIKRTAGKLSIESGYAKHPVVGVTWYGAVAYADWVGKRLPTEAEWEVASKGGNGEAFYPTGSEIEKSQANFFSSDTTPVMSYAPNAFGLYDIAGNVYEWCQDWYGYNYYETSVQEPDNPQGPVQGVYRVLRGGCWKSLREDLRCSRRHRNNPGTVNGTYGFRCAADVG